MRGPFGWHGTRHTNPDGLTINSSQHSRSMMRSAVLPMNARSLEVGRGARALRLQNLPGSCRAHSPQVRR